MLPAGGEEAFARCSARVVVEVGEEEGGSWRRGCSYSSVFRAESERALSPLSSMAVRLSEGAIAVRTPEQARRGRAAGGSAGRSRPSPRKFRWLWEASRATDPPRDLGGGERPSCLSPISTWQGETAVVGLLRRGSGAWLRRSCGALEVVRAGRAANRFCVPLARGRKSSRALPRNRNTYS